jgi:hypothetical protein
MNILLQNKKSLSYVEWGGRWTRSPESARVFQSGLEALFYCLNNHCIDMQVIGEFADARMNFTMQVTDRRGV